MGNTSFCTCTYPFKKYFIYFFSEDSNTIFCYFPHRNRIESYKISMPTHLKLSFFESISIDFNKILLVGGATQRYTRGNNEKRLFFKDVVLIDLANNNYFDKKKCMNNENIVDFRDSSAILTNTINIRGQKTPNNKIQKILERTVLENNNNLFEINNFEESCYNNSNKNVENVSKYEINGNNNNFTKEIQLNLEQPFPVLPQPRAYHSLCVLQNYLFVFGGMNEFMQPENTSLRINLNIAINQNKEKKKQKSIEEIDKPQWELLKSPPYYNGIYKANAIACEDRYIYLFDTFLIGKWNLFKYDVGFDSWKSINLPMVINKNYNFIGN